MEWRIPRGKVESFNYAIGRECCFFEVFLENETSDFVSRILLADFVNFVKVTGVLFLIVLCIVPFF